MTEYAIHRLAQLVPTMPDDQYAELRADIEQNGLNEPIVLYEGAVLDGRHRLRACEELGITPTTRRFTGDSPAAYVLSANVKRRHLTSSQRAMLVLPFMPELEAEAARRQNAGRDRGRDVQRGSGPVGPEPSPSHRARDEAGALVGVGGRTIGRAKRITTSDPQLAEKVKGGEVSLRAAERRVKQQQTNGAAPGRAEQGEKFRATVSAYQGPLEGRHLGWAKAARKRVEAVVGQCNAWDRALNEINVELAARLATTDEVGGWLESVRGARRQLVEFERRIGASLETKEEAQDV